MKNLLTLFTCIFLFTLSENLSAQTFIKKWKFDTMKTYNVPTDSLTQTFMLQMEATMKSATIEFKADGTYQINSLDLNGKPEIETGK
jgi:F0F1-type ATP synthase membrane subunit a